MIEDPYVSENPYCMDCMQVPCNCNIIIDNNCKRDTPDHSECEYSEDLLDM